MTNTDPRLASYRDRLLRLETERRENAEDTKELTQEMRKAGLSKSDIRGIKLAIARTFESEDQRADRAAAEAVADMLAASGTAPLFAAA